MLESLFILIFIIMCLLIIVGGKRLLGGFMGCILAPIKAILTFLVILAFGAFVLLSLVKQMSHGPLLHLPSGKPSTPNTSLPPVLQPNSTVYKPYLPGGNWNKEELRSGLWYLNNPSYRGNVNVHALIINLTNPRIHFKTLLGGGDGRSKQRTSSMAKSNGALAAVNGDYFGAPSDGPEGTTIVKGVSYNINPAEPGLAGRSALIFSNTGGMGTDAKIGVWRDLSKYPDRKESWMFNAVGGGPIFLVDGQYQYNYYGEDFTVPPEPDNLGKYREVQYRRTVAALSKDGKTLILFTGDGSLHSKDAADLAVELGGYRAIFLDSGGSSTFYIEGRGVLNNPSDGSERIVIDALGVFYKG